MQISFAEIMGDGLRLTMDDSSWFPSDDLALKGSPWAHIFLMRKGDRRVFLEGEIRAKAVLDCDRCLDPFEYLIKDTFEIDLELRDPRTQEPSSHENDISVMDTIYLHEPTIDIYQLLAQQVYLGLPNKKLCRDDCLGLCARCGASLNTENCRCPKETKDSPVKVLIEVVR